VLEAKANENLVVAYIV